MLLTDLAYPLPWRDGAARVARALLEHDGYLVCAHSRLDGDALGAMAAAGGFLRAAGKSFLLYAPFGVPEIYSFLPLPGQVHRSLEALPFLPRTLLVLDCGDPGRLGEELRAEADAFSSVNVDHHRGPGMGTIASLVLPEASSTTQILASVLREAGHEPSPETAEALALGLVTDTGGFRHSNTTPEVFALAAVLEGAGVSFHRLRDLTEKVWSYARIRLWGHMLGQIRLSCSGRLAVCSLSLDALEEYGAGPDDTEGFVEHMREIRSVRVSCLLREQKDETCRFSLRSGEDVDVRAIAASFGGGGHRCAAGGTLAMSLDGARRLLSQTLHRVLEGGPSSRSF